MRMVNDLVVKGDPSEVEKLVKRMRSGSVGGSWKHEPEVEANLERSVIGRLGVFCYSHPAEEARPAVSLLVYRTGPNELSSSSIISTTRSPLEEEEQDAILSEFVREVLGPLIGDLAITSEIVHPRQDRLEQSISPDAFRELSRFAIMANNKESLTRKDHSHWRKFWQQVYSDGSVVNDKDLALWLEGRGFSENQVSRLLAQKFAGQLMLRDDLES